MITSELIEFLSNYPPDTKVFLRVYNSETEECYFADCDPNEEIICKPIKGRNWHELESDRKYYLKINPSSNVPEDQLETVIVIR